jgi:hypothetical protein
LLGQLLDRRIVEHPRRDDNALLVQRARIEGHRAGHAAADVGVVCAAGREPQQLVGVLREHRGDDRDVRQVRPAAVRIVEDP